jgi:hypothetical protein
MQHGIEAISLLGGLGVGVTIVKVIIKAFSILTFELLAILQTID